MTTREQDAEIYRLSRKLALGEKAMRVLASLTPGGSEFVDDPEKCAEFVRKRRDAEHSALLSCKRKLEAFEEMLAACEIVVGDWEQSNTELLRAGRLPELKQPRSVIVCRAAIGKAEKARGGK